MTKEELAAKLDGSQYPLRLERSLQAEIKAAGLVVVYGASDDLMEFRGAIYGEIGAYDGQTARVDTEGVVPHFDDVAKDNIHALREYFKRENGGKTIDALWCEEEGYSWTYQTEIPHSTFEVMEDGDHYCRGIVFALADVL